MANRSVSVKLKADIDQFERKMAEATASTKGFASALNTSNDRMTNLVQTSLALGPALVPISAVGIPALSGLATGFTVAATAGGVAALAFAGVGDALDALNKFQLEPTKENLEEVKQAFHEIGPAASQFVMFIDELQPEIDKLQQTAAAGLLPGVQEGIEHLLDLMPRLVDITESVSREMGDIADAAGGALSGPEFKGFFEYLNKTAAPLLSDMAETIGNVAKGFADLLIAMDPLTQDFSQVLLDMSDAFHQWAEGLSSSESFTDFIDYIEQIGPQVADTLGALAEAVTSVIEALAPIGGVSLEVLQQLAQIVAGIAKSPVGPALFGMAAGLAAISKAIGLFKAANASALISFFTTVQGRDAEGKFTRSRRSLKSMATRIGAVGAAAAVAAIGIHRLAENNQDLTQAANDAADALGDEKISLSENRQAVMKLGQEVRESAGHFAKLNAVAGSNVSLSGRLISGWSGVQHLFNEFFGTTVEEGKQQFEDLTQRMLSFNQHVARFRQLLHGNSGLEGFTTDLGKLQTTLDQTVPTLKKAGYTLEDIRHLLKTPMGRRELIQAIKDYNRKSDSAQYKTKQLAKAMEALESDVKDTTTAAEQLKSALDSLLDPTLNAKEATAQYRLSLLQLQKGLKGAQNKNGELITSLDKSTIAGNKNRQMFIDLVRQLKRKVEADAKAGASTDKLTQDLKQGRQALLDAAEAAGFNREQVKKLINQYGLTPEFIKTVIRLTGDKKAKKDAKDYKDTVESIPHGVKTAINVSGEDTALGALGSVISDLNYIDGYSAYSTVTTRYRIVGQYNGGRAVVDWAEGGYVTGPGTTKSDSIPARLSNREYVMRAEAVAKYGREFFDKANSLRLAEGGPVDRVQSIAPAAPVRTVIDFERLAQQAPTAPAIGEYHSHIEDGTPREALEEAVVAVRAARFGGEYA